MKWRNNVSVHVLLVKTLILCKFKADVLGEVKVASEFVGYGTVATESNVVALVKNGEYTDSLQAGEEGQLMLDVTPFYAESGGQIADRGYLLC